MLAASRLSRPLVRPGIMPTCLNLAAGVCQASRSFSRCSRYNLSTNTDLFPPLVVSYKQRLSRLLSEVLICEKRHGPTEPSHREESFQRRVPTSINKS